MKLTARQRSALSWVGELGTGVSINSNTAKALAARELVEIVGKPVYGGAGSTCRVTEKGAEELRRRGER